GTGPVSVRGPAIPVRAGQVVTVSHYFRTSVADDMSGRPTRSRIAWLDGPGGTVQAPALELTTAYQRSVVTAVVPEGVTQMRPDIVMNSSEITGILVFDWGQVEYAPDASPYRDAALEPTPAHDADV